MKKGDRVRRTGLDGKDRGIECHRWQYPGVEVGDETEVVAIPGDEMYGAHRFREAEKGMMVKPTNLHDYCAGGEDWYWVLQSDFELVTP